MATETERSIEKTMELSAPIERVWRAITDPAEVSAWFGDRALFAAEAGSDGALEWDNHGSFAMRVEEVAAPTRLVWSWMHEAGVAFDPAVATRVEWTLTEREDGGTTLFLRESGFRTDLHHQQNTEGWNSELAELAEYVASRGG